MFAAVEERFELKQRREETVAFHCFLERNSYQIVMVDCSGSVAEPKIVEPTCTGKPEENLVEPCWRTSSFTSRVENLVLVDIAGVLVMHIVC